MPSPAHPAALVGTTLGAVLTDRTLAYIGPGAGLGAIITTLALLLGVLLLVIGLVWYPLKRLYKARMGDAAGGGRADRSE